MKGWYVCKQKRCMRVLVGETIGWSVHASPMVLMLADCKPGSLAAEGNWVQVSCNLRIDDPSRKWCTYYAHCIPGCACFHNACKYQEQSSHPRDHDAKLAILQPKHAETWLRKQ